MIFLAALVFLVFAFLAYKKPLLALASLSALLPIYLLRFEALGMPSTVLEVIIWAIFLGWLIKQLRIANYGLQATNLFSRLQKIKWPLTIFFAASVISIFAAPDKIAALGIWRAYFFESAIVFALFLAIIQDRRDFEKIVFGLSVAAFYVSVFAIAQKFFGLPIPAPWQDELRATSIFPYPNAVGLFLAPIIFLMAGTAINAKLKSPASYFLLLASVLSLAAIVLAKSDGAIFAVFAAGFIFIILNLLTNKKYKSGVMVALLVLAAGGLLFSMVEPINNKIYFKDWSGFVRVTMWQETWNMLRHSWLFGAGLSGYQAAIIPYHESRDWMEIFLYPHNIVLNFWSELGLTGLTAFLWLLEKFGKLCYTLLKRDKSFAITAIAAMAALIIHGLVDVPYFKNDLSILFWIIYTMPLIL